jgi:HK97 gp10 family phage protein
MMADNLVGLTELNAAFKKLNTNLSNKVGAKMVASAAGIIKAEAKNIAASKGLKKSGALIRNIAIKRENKVPNGVIQYHVGVKHGKDLGRKAKKSLALSKRTGLVYTKRENDPYYWSFLEFGHKTVARNSGQSGGGITMYMTTLRNGKRAKRQRAYKNSSTTGRRKSPTGFVQAKPFLQPAAANKQQEAINAMGKVLNNELLKANS